jgi:hypothetical protein
MELKVARAKEQAKRMQEVEQGYQRRIEVLNQRAALDRNRLEAERRALQGRATDLLTAKQRLGKQLEKCESDRARLTTQVNVLQKENQSLKEEQMLLRTKMQNVVREYEDAMEVLRSKTSEMETDLQRCGQKLQSAQEVHAHVDKIRADAARLKKDLQEKLKVAESNQAAFERLLRDRQQSEVIMQQLKDNAEACASARTALERRLVVADRDVRNIKRLFESTRQEVNRYKSDVQRARERREAQVERDRIEAEARERSLKRKVLEAARNERRAERKSLAEQRARDVAQNELVDSEVHHAEQLNRLREVTRAIPTSE